MKKTLIAMLTAAVILGVSAVVYADSFSASVPLQVAVPPSFGFLLEKYSHDFGSVIPGTGAETTIGIFCRSNHGLVWKLALNADPFSNGSGTIPEGSAFVCAAWGDPVGSEFEAEGTFATFPLNVPSLQTDFYTSSLAEGTKPFVPITLGLYLSVPSGQSSGLYTTDLVLTMYE